MDVPHEEKAPPFLSGTSLNSAGTPRPITLAVLPSHIRFVPWRSPHSTHKNQHSWMPFLLFGSWRHSSAERFMCLLWVSCNRLQWPKLWTGKQEAQFLSQWHYWLPVRPMAIYCPGPFFPPTVKWSQYWSDKDTKRERKKKENLCQVTWAIQR